MVRWFLCSTACFVVRVVSTNNRPGAEKLLPLGRHGTDGAGVKFLHHMAHDYDVGVYFEANGHGTVRWPLYW